MKRDAVTIGRALDAASDEGVARAARKHLRTMRGVRGVPHGELARLAAELWAEGVALPADARALDSLFRGAWEDGMIAVALVAASVPDDPVATLGLGLEWAERVDDVVTADAIGWLILGPSILASGGQPSELLALREAERPEMRRAAVAAGLAFTPATLEGPAAAAVRARLGMPHVRWVEAARSEWLAPLVDAFRRDEAPEVRKALRRVLRAWTDADPAAVMAWADSVRGGLPKLLQDEVVRARRRSAR